LNFQVDYTAECCADYALSSYSPTLVSLINARREFSSQPAKDAKILLVAQPTTPGMAPLPMTEVEVAQLSQIISSDQLLNIEPEPEQASLDNTSGAKTEIVKRLLPQCTILHLACHATQQKDNPLGSRFFLNDGTLTVTDLMQTKTPRAFFAFLSACESAAATDDLLDETVHLAAAMLFTGFRSVVGTMWLV
jgi:CHAT domain-containing protein